MKSIQDYDDVAVTKIDCFWQVLFTENGHLKIQSILRSFYHPTLGQERTIFDNSSSLLSRSDWPSPPEVDDLFWWKPGYGHDSSHGINRKLIRNLFHGVNNSFVKVGAGQNTWLKWTFSIGCVGRIRVDFTG